MIKEPLKTIEAKYLGMKFEKLVPKYPKLEKYLISKNPLKFDLGDPETLSELNKCLFKELANLDIELPKGHLIPSYSLRMTYVKAINELLTSEKINFSYPVIEIGTGASASIAMLFAKKYKRKVVATEINEVSFQLAQRNIVKNKLSSLITLIKSEGQIIKEIVPEGKYTALMCYPPIYPADLTKLEKQRGWKGVQSELIAGEGELDFAIKLLNEAINNNDVRIDLITVQLMSKKQLEKLFRLFVDKKVCEYIEINAGTRKRYIIIIKR